MNKMLRFLRCTDFYLNYLPAAVIAAVLANLVRPHGCLAVFTLRQLNSGKRVMGAPLVSRALGFSLFGNTHIE